MWHGRGIDYGHTEIVVFSPGALVVGWVLVLLLRGCERKGNGMFDDLNGSFADTNVLADANFNALVSEGAGQGGGLCGMDNLSDRAKRKRVDMPSIPGNFLAV